MNYGGIHSNCLDPMSHGCCCRSNCHGPKYDGGVHLNCHDPLNDDYQYSNVAYVSDCRSKFESRWKIQMMSNNHDDDGDGSVLLVEIDASILTDGSNETDVLNVNDALSGIGAWSYDHVFRMVAKTTMMNHLMLSRLTNNLMNHLIHRHYD